MRKCKCNEETLEKKKLFHKDLTNPVEVVKCRECNKIVRTEVTVKNKNMFDNLRRFLK